MQQTVEVEDRRPSGVTWTGWWIDGAGAPRFVSSGSEKRALSLVHAGIIQHGVTVTRDAMRGPGVRLSPVGGLGLCLAAGLAPHSDALVAEVRVLAAELVVGHGSWLGVEVSPMQPRLPSALLATRVRSELNKGAASDDEVVSVIRALIDRSEHLDNLRTMLRAALGGAFEDAGDDELVTMVELLQPTHQERLLVALRKLVDGAEHALLILSGGPREVM